MQVSSKIGGGPVGRRLHVCGAGQLFSHLYSTLVWGVLPDSPFSLSSPGGHTVQCIACCSFVQQAMSQLSVHRMHSRMAVWCIAGRVSTLAKPRLRRRPLRARWRSSPGGRRPWRPGRRCSGPGGRRDPAGAALCWCAWRPWLSGAPRPRVTRQCLEEGPGKEVAVEVDGTHPA